MPKKYVESRREITLSLPESILSELDLMFFDPVRGKPAFGRRSEFISQAIREKLTNAKEPSNV